MLDPKEELKLAEKRTQGYLFSIFLFLGIAVLVLIISRANLSSSYTSYLNAATVISGGVGLVDIGLYLFARREYLKQKDGTEVNIGN
jgi:hypothetical protein